MLFTTILTFFGGLITSLLPNLIRMWEKRQDHRYEVEILKIKLEAQAKGLATAESIAGYDDAISARSHDTNITYTDSLSGLRASVRPIITYALFLLFCSVKAVVIYVMIYKGADAETIARIAWSVEEMSIFGAIIGFWFGGRGYERAVDWYTKKNNK